MRAERILHIVLWQSRCSKVCIPVKFDFISYMHTFPCAMMCCVLVQCSFLPPDNSLGAEKANFLKEIEMMKNVSGTNSDLQKFVVNMVGCVTVEEPMMLVLEFVTHGDLLSYLRAIRKKVLNSVRKDIMCVYTNHAHAHMYVHRLLLSTLTPSHLW